MVGASEISDFLGAWQQASKAKTKANMRNLLVSRGEADTASLHGRQLGSHKGASRLDGSRGPGHGTPMGVTVERLETTAS